LAKDPLLFPVSGRDYLISMPFLPLGNLLLVQLVGLNLIEIFLYYSLF